MTGPVVVDTSILIDHLRTGGSATRLLHDGFESRRLITASVMTKVEVMAGMRAHQQEATESVFRLLEWVPATDDIAEMAGGLARDYARSHPGIEVVDYVIAATARELGAELWTRNAKHFPMFPELRDPYLD